MDDEGVETVTSIEQKKLEDSVGDIYDVLARFPHAMSRVKLWRTKHILYLERGLEYLPSSFTSLDSSRPWLCYWIVHSLSLLGEPMETELASRCIETLRRCQHTEGGFGGGPGQMAHLATSYAAICALITIGGPQALATINRPAVLSFLLRMKHSSGGFRMHDDGEIDVRGCYTALAVAHLLDIMEPELVKDVDKYIVSCQTYEGGIGGEPGVEAHGGYTYCGLAALLLAGKLDALDIPSLLDWVVARQGSVEGGFQGRTNKLVDGCYSFWQGSLFLLLRLFLPEHISTSRGEKNNVSSDRTSIDASHEAQQRDLASGNDFSANDSREEREEVKEEVHPYKVELPLSSAAVLFTSEERVLNDRNQGGSIVISEVDPDKEEVGVSDRLEEEEEELAGKERLRENKAEEIEGGRASEDKPLFNSHALQGYMLICCQVPDGGLIDKPGKMRDYYHSCYCLSGLSCAQRYLSWPCDPPLDALVGPFENLIEATEPRCNVRLDRYREARDYFTNEGPL